ncbi:hypothetical protein [Bacteroides pyogenes]|nr:hypothetical protein [Bacteroides pyogenes]
MAELKNPLINPIQAKTAVFTLTQQERKNSFYSGYRQHVGSRSME